jgi:hypothetical protein
MRYIKTYESFSTNEEFLDKFMNKISSAFTNWKNDKLKKNSLYRKRMHFCVYDGKKLYSLTSLKNIFYRG